MVFELISIFGGAILSSFSKMSQTHAGYFMAADRRIAIADRMKRVPMGYFNDNSTGQLSGVCTTVVSTIENMVPMVLVNILGGLITTAVFALLILVFGWRIGLITLAGILLYLLVVSAMEKKTAVIAEETQRSQTDLVEAILETVQGMSVVKSFNLTGKGDRKLQNVLEHNRAANLREEQIMTPYGYRKDPQDKNHLLPDPDAAAVVQRIFRLAAEKHAPREIAALLNADGIPSPMRYKQENSCSRERWPSIHESNFWTKGVIYKILRDERYLGTAIYGKRERDMVGLTHSVKKAKADWITVEAAHEGIIEPELFQAAQAELKAFSEKDSPAPNANPLRRKVICGYCGYAMQLVKAKAPYYRCCSAELGLPHGCKTEPVSQTDIQDAVLALIRTYAQCAVDLDRLQAE